MSYEEIIALIERANKEAQERYIPVSIFGLEYGLGMTELYEGDSLDESSDGVPLYLCNIFIAWNDEHNSRECDILVEPETLKEILEVEQTKIIR